MAGAGKKILWEVQESGGFLGWAAAAGQFRSRLQTAPTAAVCLPLLKPWQRVRVAGALGCRLSATRVSSGFLSPAQTRAGGKKLPCKKAEVRGEPALRGWDLSSSFYFGIRTKTAPRGSPLPTAGPQPQPSRHQGLRRAQEGQGHQVPFEVCSSKKQTCTEERRDAHTSGFDSGKGRGQEGAGVSPGRAVGCSARGPAEATGPCVPWCGWHRHPQPVPNPCPRPLFQMTFFFSDRVVLLFDFWSVHTPAGRLPAPSVRPSAAGCARQPGKGAQGTKTTGDFCISGI